MESEEPWVRFRSVWPLAFLEFWAYYESTKEERLVFQHPAGVIVMKPGRHRVPLDRRVSGAAFVSMAPHPIPAEWENVRSSDAIPFKVVVTLNMSVVDEEWAIARVALNARSEQQKALDAVLGCLQGYCASTSAAVLQAENLQHAGAGVLAEVADLQARDRQAARQSAFSVTSILLRQVIPTDPHLAAAPVERLKQALRLTEAHEEAVRRKSEKRAELDLKQIEVDLEKLVEEAALARQKEREALALSSERERKKMEMEFAGERAKLLKDINGLFSLHPERAEAIELARIKAEVEKARSRQELFSLVVRLKDAFTAGQLNIASQVVTQHTGLEVKTNLDVEKLLSGIGASDPKPGPPTPPEGEGT